jgi:hypothetical protein
MPHVPEIPGHAVVGGMEAHVVRLVRARATPVAAAGIGAADGRSAVPARAGAPATGVADSAPRPPRGVRRDGTGGLIVTIVAWYNARDGTRSRGGTAFREAHLRGGVVDDEDDTWNATAP